MYTNTNLSPKDQKKRWKDGIPGGRPGVQQLAAAIGLRPWSQLCSKARAGLPSPKALPAKAFDFASMKSRQSSHFGNKSSIGFFELIRKLQLQSKIGG